MTLKTKLILLSLLATASGTFAADTTAVSTPAATTATQSVKPDGILGVDTISIFSNYYNDDQSYYHANNYEEVGYGIGISKNLFNGQNLGLDVGAKYYYVYPVSPKEHYYDQRTVTASATAFYKMGDFLPFFTAQVFHHTTSSQSTTVSGRVGVEYHILNGWSASPYIAYTVDPGMSEQKSAVQYGANTSYWFTSKFGVSTGAAYIKYRHLDEFSYILSLNYRFD
jgi:hypothetical protein